MSTEKDRADDNGKIKLEFPKCDCLLPSPCCFRVQELEATLRGWITANAPGGWIDAERVKSRELEREVARLKGLQ